MDGIAYAVDLKNRIIGVGQKGWDRFARSNGAPELASGKVLGQDLLQIMKGDEVRDVYLHHTKNVLTSEEAVAFSTRCDSPSVKRELRLSLSPLKSRGTIRGLLFQALVVDEQVRPPIDIFDFGAAERLVAEVRNVPIVTLCSFCQRVKADRCPDSEPWLDAAEYYHRGGTSKVRISHGLCPDCSKAHYGY